MQIAMNKEELKKNYKRGGKGSYRRGKNGKLT